MDHRDLRDYGDEYLRLSAVYDQLQDKYAAAAAARDREEAARDREEAARLHGIMQRLQHSIRRVRALA